MVVVMGYDELRSSALDAGASGIVFTAGSLTRIVQLAAFEAIRLGRIAPSMPGGRETGPSRR